MKTAKVERIEKRMLLYRVGVKKFSHEIENGTDRILGGCWVYICLDVVQHLLCNVQESRQKVP